MQCAVPVVFTVGAPFVLFCFVFLLLFCCGFHLPVVCFFFFFVPQELDSDMADDVITLAGMLDGPLLDVKTDAATAVAGLTADGEADTMVEQ